MLRKIFLSLFFWDSCSLTHLFFLLQYEQNNYFKNYDDLTYIQGLKRATRPEKQAERRLARSQTVVRGCSPDTKYDFCSQAPANNMHHAQVPPSGPLVFAGSLNCFLLYIIMVMIHPLVFYH